MTLGTMTDELLIETIINAVNQELDESFIILLFAEITVRGIKNQLPHEYHSLKLG